jgi:hypothetical protein
MTATTSGSTTGTTSGTTTGTTSGSTTGAGGGYCQGGDYHLQDCCIGGQVAHDCCVPGTAGGPVNGVCGGSSGMGGAPISDASTEEAQACTYSCSAAPGTPVCACPPGSADAGISGHDWCDRRNPGPGTSFFDGQCQLDEKTMCGCRECDFHFGCWYCWPKGQPSPGGFAGAPNSTFFCCGDCGDAGPDSASDSGSGGGGAGGTSAAIGQQP